MGATAGYCPPVENWTGVSTWSAHTNRGVPSTEPGTDFYCPRGTPIRSAASGRVVDVGDSIQPATGRFVTIDLDDGRRVRYLHLERRHVNVGQRVQWGQHIADSGATGYGEADWSWNVTETGGAHVHMTLWPGHYYAFGRYTTLDPEQYMDSNGGEEMNADEQNALYSTWKAVFQGGGDAGDQSIVARLVEIQNNLRAIVPRVTNLDQQVTGADDFDSTVGASVAGRLISVQGGVEALTARPATQVTEAQVKQIAAAIVAAIGKPTVAIDYAAIAKAVNDEQAKRLAA